MNNPIEKIKNGLAAIGQKVGVVSTVSSEGMPESAVVYFSSDENLNMYFTTRSDSRKYKNITANPHVAFVIYSENPPETIQIEGIASAITDPYEQTVLFSSLVDLATKDDSVPPVDQISESEIMFIKISTTWARLGDFEIERKEELFTQVIK